MSGPRMHRCPACRLREIEWPRLVCTRCWPGLPATIRAALADVADRSDPAAWLAAASPALDWIVDDRAHRLHGVQWNTRTTRKRAA